MQNKGDSVLLSWVLLVGFSITLSIMVTTWVKDRSESSARELIEKTEGDVRCNDVALNAATNCSASSSDIIVINKGIFTIKKVKLRYQETTADIPIIIEPMQAETLNRNIAPGQALDIIPVIMIEGKEVVCATRKVTIAC